MAILKGPTALANFPVPMSLSPLQMALVGETAQEDQLVEDFLMQEEEFGAPSDMSVDTQSSDVFQTPQPQDTSEDVQLPAQPLSSFQHSNAAYVPSTPTLEDLSNYHRKRTRREVDGNYDYTFDDRLKPSETEQQEKESNADDDMPPLEDDDRVQPQKEKEKEKETEHLHQPGHHGTAIASLKEALSKLHTDTPEWKQLQEELDELVVQEMMFSECFGDLQQPSVFGSSGPAPRLSKPFLSPDPTGLCRGCGLTGHDRSRCCTHPNEHNREFRVKRFRWNDAEILVHISEALRDHQGVEGYNYRHTDDPPPRSDQNEVCHACGWPGHDHHHCWVPPKYFNKDAEHFTEVTSARRLLNWFVCERRKYTTDHGNSDPDPDERPKCEVCSLYGHVAEDCWTPPEYKATNLRELHKSRLRSNWKRYLESRMSA